MGKRYKEFLIDILTKSYQIVLGVAIISPIATKHFDFKILIPSIIFASVLIFWAAAIAGRMEG
jgi:hypothetical protein